jgi:hypothetical protein
MKSIHIGTANDPESVNDKQLMVEKEIDVNDPSVDVNQEAQQSSPSAGKWKSIAIFMMMLCTIVVIVVPPSVVVPQKKNKSSSSSSSVSSVYSSPITVAEIDAAQKAWGEALVKISDTYRSSGFAAAKTLAQQVLDAAYGYNIGKAVSFKPTLTYGAQTFRFTNEGALAYFVGGNSKV